MTQIKTAEDWTDDAVRNIWSWYTSRPEQVKRYFSRRYAKAVRNLLGSTGRLQGRLLDYGCGPGFLLKMLCRVNGLECAGLDLSPKNAEETRRLLESRESFIGAEVVDSLPSPFADRSFDVVTCCEVIEHLNDEHLESTITEIFRVLKPGGTALFTTPNDENLEASQSYCPFCDSQFHTWQHVRTFRAEDLTSRLEGAGFDVTFCRCINLDRFQRPRRRSLMNVTPGHLLDKSLRAFHHAEAFATDAFLRREFPNNRRFKWRAGPGPHLVAVVERPGSTRTDEA